MTTAPHPIAVCVGCGCDDFHACESELGPCRWLRVDYGLGLGVCSECPEHVEAWDRTPAGPQRLELVNTP